MTWVTIPWRTRPTTDCRSKLPRFFYSRTAASLEIERTDEVQADSTLDVSHEALLRHWERVQTWLEQEAEAKHTFLHLAEIAHLWENAQADVLSPPELDGALQSEAEAKAQYGLGKTVRRRLAALSQVPPCQPAAGSTRRGQSMA